VNKAVSARLYNAATTVDFAHCRLLNKPFFFEKGSTSVSVRTVHRAQSSFDPCNAVTAPDDFAKPQAELSADPARNAGEPMRTKYKARRGVVLLFSMVAAVLVAGAGVAARNMRGAIAEPSLAMANFLLVVLFYRLIMRRQDLERRLENLAMTDPLTGLANRRALETALESAVSRAKRHSSDLSVIFMDVDHFKQFNDRFGHKAGDEVLRAVARVVQSSVRVEDVAGRYGGEEFLVVLPETGEAGSVTTAERIRAGVRALDLPLPPVTISLGVATLGAQSSNVAALVAQADEALYVSKQSGRDRVTLFHSLW